MTHMCNRLTRLHFAPRPVAGAGGVVHRLPSDDPGDQDEPVQAGQRRRGRGPQHPGDAASRVRRRSAPRFFTFTYSRTFALKRWCLCVWFFCFLFFSSKPRLCILADSDEESSSAGSSDEEEAPPTEPQGCVGDKSPPVVTEG